MFLPSRNFYYYYWPKTQWLSMITSSFNLWMTCCCRNCSGQWLGHCRPNSKKTRNCSFPSHTTKTSNGGSASSFCLFNASRSGPKFQPGSWLIRSLSGASRNLKQSEHDCVWAYYRALITFMLPTPISVTLKISTSREF